MNFPYISIVLAVYNAQTTLASCLDSLIAINYPKEKLEIIVVDNNSTDATKEIISKYNVKNLFEPKKGAPYALNRGIKNSHGEIIAFTHGDCVVDKNWIKNIVKEFNESNVGGCGGKVLIYNLRSWIEKYYDEKNYRNGYITKGQNFLPYVMLANAAFRRKALDEVRLFDEFFTEEYDIDLSFRIYLKGYQLKYTTKAITSHKSRDTLAGLWCQCFRIGYNTPRFVKKYGKIYESVYIASYKNLPYIFWKVICGFFQFFKNLITKKWGVNTIFPLLDNVVFSALFLGGIFGWLELVKNNNRKFNL